MRRCEMLIEFIGPLPQADFSAWCSGKGYFSWTRDDNVAIISVNTQAVPVLEQELRNRFPVIGRIGEKDHRVQLAIMDGSNTFRPWQNLLKRGSVQVSPLAHAAHAR